MIVADKEALATELKQSSLSIQEKEINFFTSNFNSLATQSALLAGFAFSGACSSITQPPLNAPDPSVRAALSGIETKDDHTLLAFFFYASTAISMCLNLLVVISCTFCNMWGPGLALRGPNGSMAKAVNGMDAERQEIFLFFGLGLWFLMLGLIAVAWCKAFWHNALLVTVISLVFMQLFLRYTKRIWDRFSLESGSMVSGQLVLGGVDAASFAVDEISRQEEDIRQQEGHQGPRRTAHTRRTSALGDAPFKNLDREGSAGSFNSQLPRPTHRGPGHQHNPTQPERKQKRWSLTKSRSSSNMGVSNQPPLSQVDQSNTFSLRGHRGHAAV
jgi:hypothetical protein